MSEAQANGLLRRRSLRVRARAAAAGSKARPRTLGIVSGKGGVGKSAVATNVALACARSGASTLLIDGDAGLANVDLLMGLVPPYTWTDVVDGRVRSEEAILHGPYGLDLLVAGRGRRGLASLAEALDDLRRDGRSPRLAFRDHSLLDLGAGIGDDVVELAARCDSVWLVMTPEPTSLADAYATVRRLEQTRPGRAIELVVNRSTDAAESEQAARSLQRLARRFLGRTPRLRAVLPEDTAMGRAVLRQEPVLESAPRSRIARSLDHLAQTWLEESGHAGAATASAAASVPG